MGIRQTDIITAPFQRFLEALVRKLMGKAAVVEAVAVPSSAEGEAIFGVPMQMLDAMDAASVARVLSNARFLEVYATLVAAKGGHGYARAAALLQAAIAAGHAEPQRLREAIAALTL